MRWALLASYPLLSHLALTRGQPWFEWGALTVLFAGIFLSALTKGKVAAWAGFAGVAVMAWALMWIDTGRYALFLPPLVLPGIAATTFGLSLRAGHTALITRIATVMHGGYLEPELQRYTRRITWVWLVFLVGAMIVEIGAAAFCSRATWSLVSNLYGYLAMGALFVIEYLYRRIRFRNLAHPALADYLKVAAALRSGPD